MKTLIALSFMFVAALADRCAIGCNRMLKPVCGSDGKTYDNECELRRAACLKGEAITAVKNGKCTKVVDSCILACRRIYRPVCGHDGKMYANECVLRAQACRRKEAISIVKEGKDCTKCNIACNRMRKPVCGSDGKTYSNECVMRTEACKQQKAIMAVKDGECPKKRCFIPCNRMLKPVCGSDGKTYSNECELRRAACLKGEAITAVKDGKCTRVVQPCFLACRRIYRPVCGHDGKMYSNECVLRAQACRRKEAISIVKEGKDCTKCNIACNRMRKPVCGSDGKTYSNECVMRTEACKQQKAIMAVKDREC